MSKEEINKRNKLIAEFIHNYTYDIRKPIYTCFSGKYSYGTRLN